MKKANRVRALSAAFVLCILFAFPPACLAIGPEIAYCGYLGGPAYQLWGVIAVDAAGCAYVAGVEYPVGKPATSWVAKVRIDGSGLEYFTVIGSGLMVRGIAVDGSGRAVVAGGATSGSSLATTGGFGPTYNGGSGDGFVARLSPSGAAIEYAGFIGGDGDDSLTCVALDPDGNIYLGGQSDSTPASFPLLVGPGSDQGLLGNEGAGFVARLKSDGSALDYCGYIGGYYTMLDSIAADNQGRATISGRSIEDLPVTVGPALQPVNPRSGPSGFVARVKANGSGFVYCGWLGPDEDFMDGTSPTAVAVDAAGCAYVTGHAPSRFASLFPVSVGPDLTHNGGSSDAYIAKVKADGSGLVYCGYIGGSGNDRGSGVAVDGLGDVWVTGSTTSTESSFPVSGGPSLTQKGQSDGFLVRVKADGSGFESGGFIGGAGLDGCNQAAAGVAGDLYLVGGTGSTPADGFPVAGGPGLVPSGGPRDLFVAKLHLPPSLSLDSPNGDEIWPLGATRTVSWKVQNISGPVRLVLFEGARKIGSLASIPAGHSSYAWTVGRLASGTMALPGSNYRLRILDGTNTYSDFSDASFTIAGLRLTSPNGGELWELGSSRTVRWNAPGVGGTVRLVLYQGGTKLGTIATGLPAGQGSFSWTAGNHSGGTAPAGTAYRIKIVTADNSASDFSDAAFSLVVH